MTTRRGFLKGLAAAPAVVAAPVLAAKVVQAQSARGPVTAQADLSCGGGGDARLFGANFGRQLRPGIEKVYAEEYGGGFGLAQCKIEGGDCEYDPG